MFIKAGDKRKSKRVEQTPKKCLWCEELIPIGVRSPAQYNKIQTHKNCVTSWAHYRMSKRLAEEIKDRGIVHCEACGKQLERRDNEQFQAWEKRRFCNKSCAATGKAGNRQDNFKKAVEVSEQERLHVKRYIPGTPEFHAVAALYL